MHSGQLYFITDFITEQFFKRVVDNDIKCDILTTMESYKKVCKLLKGIFRNPRIIRFEDLDRLLRTSGYEPRQPRKGSSHYTYRKKGSMLITVPYKRPYVKEIYVKQIIKLLDLEEYYERNCKKRS